MSVCQVFSVKICIKLLYGIIFYLYCIVLLVWLVPDNAVAVAVVTRAVVEADQVHVVVVVVTSTNTGQAEDQVTCLTKHQFLSSRSKLYKIDRKYAASYLAEWKDNIYIGQKCISQQLP